MGPPYVSHSRGARSLVERPRTNVHSRIGPGVADRELGTVPNWREFMNLMRHTITAGVAVLSLAVGAVPALARGGGDTNNTVVSVSGTTTTTAPEPAPLNGLDL